ncbi:MAG: beta-glucosidase BglX [Cyclobacteriaceae bacterium]
MKINTSLKLFLLAAVLLASCSEKTSESSQNSMDGRIDSLMSLMTLEEKLGQLNLPSAGDINTGLAQSTGIVSKIKQGKVGGLFNIKTAEKIREIQKIAVEESRLKIPLLFGMDVIHGYKTIFPIPLALSSTWNMELIKQSAQIAAKEASADGISWTFSPMVDISRDPRWGRILEGSGEDPYMGSMVAKAMVEGYQGDDLASPYTLMACVKHFALYGASEAGRDYGTVDMSRQRMYNEYFAPYKAAVDAGAGSMMASFNEVDGLPATGNRWLMTEVLREQWGFDGFVVSDYTGVTEMVEHGVGDTLGVAALALNAGIDMDMVSDAISGRGLEALEKGLISVQMINQACRRILEAKFKLGLFDDPYKYCDLERSKTELFTAENRAAARKMATESFVLLKNENEVLPLKMGGTVAVIGPMANNRENVVGSWSVAGDYDQAISLLEGLENVAGDQVDFLYAKGANVYEDAALEARVSIFGKPTYRDERSAAVLRAEALAVAKKSDVIIAALGEVAEMSGESSSRTDIQIPEIQQELLRELLKTGKPVVLVLFAGRPMVLTEESKTVPAILNVWFGGTEAGNAIADVLFGAVNPSGKLTVTFPQNIGQIPIFYNHKNTGRPLPEGTWFQKFKSNYLDVTNEPLYPFGYGLSYTSFEYGELELSTTQLKAGQKMTASIEVTNAGKYDGSEVVQLYIRDLVGSVSRPVKELKGFEKIEIKAGETRKVSFEITSDDLRFYNYDLNHVWEAGDFQVMVGSNSEEVKVKDFELIQ